MKQEQKKEMIYQKQVLNPYPTGGQSYTAWENGFIQGYELAATPAPQSGMTFSHQAEIVRQRLSYHFAKVGGGWDIPSGMPFMKEFLNEVARLCEAAPQSDADGWISVDERKPNISDTDKWGLVLANYKSGRRLAALYDELSSSVTHWQRLPAAPKTK